MAVSVLQNKISCRDCHEEQKIDRGCEVDSAIPNRWEIEGESYKRCPVKLITNVSGEYLQAYSLYKLGFLPNGNGWFNESGRFIQAMQTIDKSLAKEENER